MRLDVKIAILKSGKRQWQIAQEASINESRLSRYVQGHGRLNEPECHRLAKVLGLQTELEDHTRGVWRERSDDA
jgi:Helix-turn-helix domain